MGWPSATRALACVVVTLGFSTATLAQEPAAPGKRPIDLLTGMIFFCFPLYDTRWTIEACEALTTEATALAKAGGVPFAVLDASTDPNQSKLKAAAAGFDSVNALSVTLQFEQLRRVEKGWGLNLSGKGIAIPQPNDGGQQRRAFFVQGATLDVGISTREVIQTGKSLLGGFFKFYTTPEAPLKPQPPPAAPRPLTYPWLNQRPK